MTTIPLGTTAAGEAIALPLRLANRHGLITGATGTGKTVTLQRLAEGFSAAGVPVFMADIKGDLTGLATSFPVRFFDLFGEQGLPMRTSVHEMGPLLLARMLELNDTQEGILNIAFRWSPHGVTVPLRDLHDLRARLSAMLDYLPEIRAAYGNVAAAPIAVIQRALLVLDTQGGDRLFGEPAFDIADLLTTTTGEPRQRVRDGSRVNGLGTINLLAADRLLETPRLYATFLLWLLTALFDHLPEAGDADKPRLVFFFDEAHLLFADAPKRLLETIERTVRLIRSKGVGVYFVTQSPRDVPDSVQAQLSHRIQHALRVYTARDRRMLKAVADGFRPPAHLADAPKKAAAWIEAEVTTLSTGEALVSLLTTETGAPMPVVKVNVTRPVSQIGPIADAARAAIIAADALAGKYTPALDRPAQFRAFCKRLVTTGELPSAVVAEAFAPPPAAASWLARLFG
jgi:hypothetical protein